jgi:DNA gyrase subunit A
MIAIQCSERNGKLVGAQLVSGDDEIMLITTGGVLIRTRVSEIREAGRSTQGVRLINLGDNEALAGVEKIVESDESNGNGANGTAHADSAPEGADNGKNGAPS